MTRIYLDNNATTPADPELLDRWVELASKPLNPSSPHSEGLEARALFDGACQRVLAALDLSSHMYRVIFTGSATEALNLGIRGYLARHAERTLFHSSIEHAAVLATAALLKSQGRLVQTIDVNQSGELAGIPSEAGLYALQYANNETGVILDLKEFYQRSSERVLLLDACQGPGKAPLVSAVRRLMPELIVLSGHKMHAPVGVACLIVARSVALAAEVTGGEQQYGLRGGTESVALAAIFADALEKALSRDLAALAAKRDALWQALCQVAPDAERTHTHNVPQLANTIHFRLPGVSAERSLIALDVAGVACSSSSACQSGATEPSTTMLGLGFSRNGALEGLRLCVSHLTTDEEVGRACEALTHVFSRLTRSGAAKA